MKHFIALLLPAFCIGFSVKLDTLDKALQHVTDGKFSLSSTGRVMFNLGKGLNCAPYNCKFPYISVPFFGQDKVGLWYEDALKPDEIGHVELPPKNLAKYCGAVNDKAWRKKYEGFIKLKFIEGKCQMKAVPIIAKKIFKHLDNTCKNPNAIYSYVEHVVAQLHNFAGYD